MFPPAQLEPLGDRCLMVRFGDRVDAAVNEAVHAYATSLLREPPQGLLDVVPAFTTVAVHVRPGTDAQALADHLARLLDAGPAEVGLAARRVEIPVCYGGEAGPDLEEVAAACGLSVADVIERHAASAHWVCMLGFAPGFPYMAGLDPLLQMPRRATPRVRIAPGTVAIARDQSCVYTLETPGGWNLIGRTPVALFTPLEASPTLLRPGDRVRFVPIAAEAFDTARARVLP